MTYTGIGVIVLLVLALLWEGWVIGTGRATISEVVQTAAIRRPIVAFLAGVLAGHFFWLNENCVTLLGQVTK